ncbi:MAG: hydrogenase maturation protease [Blastocatellia bacterium]|nr:hydrogenase maturation protease [Blastocatellia bacterium]
MTPEENRPLTPKRILVAGIGNIFFGDDAFGVEVVQALYQRVLPEGVAVKDFGIRGFDLACALTDGYETVILVDAVALGEPPGTLFVIEPERTGCQPPGLWETGLEPHSLHPMKVMELAQALGNEISPVLLVGCEPACLGSEHEEVFGLSQTVAAAIPKAVGLIESLVEQLVRQPGPAGGASINIKLWSDSISGSI